MIERQNTGTGLKRRANGGNPGKLCTSLTLCKVDKGDKSRDRENGENRYRK